MDCSNALNKISGLPSKSKRPSIRKHSIVVIFTINSIVLVFPKSHLSRDIWQIFFRQYFSELLENSSSASKYVPKVLETSQKYNHGEVLC